MAAGAHGFVLNPGKDGKTKSNNGEWGLEEIGFIDPGYYDESTGKGVDVFVFSSGVRFTHSEFGGRAFPYGEVREGEFHRCKYNDRNCAKDSSGDGTAYAGVIARKKKNGISQQHGVAPEARVYGVKIGENNRSYSLQSFVVSLRHITQVKTPDHKPWVVFTDWVAGSCGRKCQRKLKGVMKHAWKKKITVVANSFVPRRDDEVYPTEVFPAALDHVIGVGPMSQLAGENWPADDWEKWVEIKTIGGRRIDLWAPGPFCNTLSHQDDQKIYQRDSAGSAGAFVAGAAALHLSLNPKDGPSQVRKRLLLNAQKGTMIIDDWDWASPNLVLSVKHQEIKCPDGMIYNGGGNCKCTGLWNGLFKTCWQLNSDGKYTRNCDHFKSLRFKPSNKQATASCTTCKCSVLDPNWSPFKTSNGSSSSDAHE